eukprot:CAMPEP_0178440842 /NCGR_PEP_ID=MMETSP0689_2-20121128/37057_1 /TAXON_ID=160604 /ORGANISM="Amphidinium massartii, Strain CS-259" /LENGTH=804 /DNA_ID=CAMNT_0020063769 /DNA_START=187 /DNA_END=2597 /DNA_ORIENTATION=+
MEAEDDEATTLTPDSPASTITGISCSSRDVMRGPTSVLGVRKLQGYVNACIRASTREEAEQQLAPILRALRSRDELTRSFLRGGNSSPDYAGIFTAFEQLFSHKVHRWAGLASRAVRLAATEAFKGACEENLDGGSWLTVMLAALLPLLSDALPRDANGICVIPHKHRMDKTEAGEASFFLTGSGRPAFTTNKVCDNCQARIMDRYYYHCSENCDIDFCEDCHQKLQTVFAQFFQHEEVQDCESRRQQLMWVVTIVDYIASYIFRQRVVNRHKLADELAFEWPTEMFLKLVHAVIDVTNAKVVHVQDVKDIQSDKMFWYAVAFLQFLYAANSLLCDTRRLDEEASRSPKIEYENFIVEGINKCEAISEWQRWQKHPSAQVPDVLSVETFEPTADFCSFLTHTNLVPVSFRRVCLLCDVWEQIQIPGDRLFPLHLEVRRRPSELLSDVMTKFSGLGEKELRRPLRVIFQGEEGAGLGVTREFFQVTLRSFLDSRGLFRYNEQQRSYWFNEEANNPEAFRAYGILLGQAVLNNVLVPNIFPRALYQLLLHDLGSPTAKRLGLEDLATVCKDTASCMQKVLDYNEPDIGSVFAEWDFASVGCLPKDKRLSQETKVEIIQAYVDWWFHCRISAQFQPLSEGFRVILGGSSLLQSMVDAVQLERIVCGGCRPVEIPAIRRGARHEGWGDDECEYLASFWEVLLSFSDSEKVQFVVFVTASDRVPLRGWQDLQLTVQKNGVGDDRLPTAHTCFAQLLLPRYTSVERLRSNLLLAIATERRWTSSILAFKTKICQRIFPAFSQSGVAQDFT